MINSNRRFALPDEPSKNLLGFLAGTSGFVSRGFDASLIQLYNHSYNKLHGNALAKALSIKVAWMNYDPASNGTYTPILPTNGSSKVAHTSSQRLPFSFTNIIDATHASICGKYEGQPWTTSKPNLPSGKR